MTDWGEISPGPCPARRLSAVGSPVGSVLPEASVAVAGRCEGTKAGALASSTQVDPAEVRGAPSERRPVRRGALASSSPSATWVGFGLGLGLGFGFGFGFGFGLAMASIVLRCSLGRLRVRGRSR